MQRKTYFCWIRVADHALEKKPLPTPKGHELDAELKSKLGTAIENHESVAELKAELCAVVEKYGLDRGLKAELCAVILNHDKYPNWVVSGPRGLELGKYPAGVWSTHPKHHDKGDVESTFLCGPAFLSERAALEWRWSDEGKEWVAESLNVCLMAFSYVPD